MKGLVIKDLMCLKKQLITFCYIVISVLVVSIMYVLSAKYGNIASINQYMSEDLSEIDIKNISSLVMIMFMLLPVADVCDFVTIFREDNKASFSKISAALPLSISQRVGAKYITVFLLFGIGAFIDICIAVILSQLTDILTFSEFMGVILSITSVMCMYSCLVILFCLLFKGGNEDLATICSLGTLLFIAVTVNWRKVIKVIWVMVGVNPAGESEMEETMIMIPDMLHYLQEKMWVFILAALVILVVSYLLSVLIAKRKRGVV